MDEPSDGLYAVGFAAHSDLLLAAYSWGRVLLDGRNGWMLAADPTEGWEEEDLVSLEACGIGPLAGETIRLAGRYGGGLTRATRDGWRAERVALDWPQERLLLVPPGSELWADASRGQPCEFYALDADSVVHAFGFSPTGRTLVVATGTALRAYARPKDDSRQAPPWLMETAPTPPEHARDRRLGPAD